MTVDPTALQTVSADTLPAEIVDLINDRAGKQHSRTGSVLAATAEVINLWEQLRDRSGRQR